MKKKRNAIFDKVLLILTALAIIIVPFGFYLPLKLILNLREIIIDFIYSAITLLGLSIYGLYFFLKEENIRGKRYLYILATLCFYLIFMSLIMLFDKLHIIPLEYLIGRAYRAWFTGMVYFAILLFIWVYIAEKIEKK